VVLLAERDGMTAHTFALLHPDANPAPPPLLAEFWRFLRYQLPPNGGGMRDQPLGWFEGGEMLDRIYRAWRGWTESDKGPTWRKEHPELMQVVKTLRGMGYG
jgi:hypothetical protein